MIVVPSIVLSIDDHTYILACLCTPCLMESNILKKAENLLKIEKVLGPVVVESTPRTHSKYTLDIILRCTSDLLWVLVTQSTVPKAADERAFTRAGSPTSLACITSRHISQRRCTRLLQTPSIAIWEDAELQDGRTQSSSPSLGIKSPPSWSRTSTIRARTPGVSISHRSRIVPNRAHWSPSTPRNLRFNPDPDFSRK